MKKKILVVLSILLIAAMAITGTMAYLTDEQSDVNVMTVGNVKIQQLEYERDENGNLREFTQDKPIVPAVYDGDSLPWSNGLYVWDSIDGVPAGAGNQLFVDGANAVDKFVFVRNTGKTDAYYRTVIAIECPEGLDPDMIHINVNGNTRFTWSNVGYTTIDGVQYFVKEALYNEILTPGETSRPSLLQVYLDKAATNEDVELFGDRMEVLAVSQAVQAEGFADSNTALDTAFYDVTTVTHPWMNGVVIPQYVYSEADLDKVATAGAPASVIIGDDIALTSESGNIIISDLTIDLNSKTISTVRPYPSASGTTESISALVIRGSNVTIEGEGTIVNEDPTSAYAVSVYDGATVTIKGGNFISGHDALYVKEGTLIIEGGFFVANLDTVPGPTDDSAGCFSSSVINCYDDTYRVGAAIVIVKGGTFVNFDPSNVHEGKIHNQNFVADGYKVVAAAQANGDIWYTVVPE
ncbi:MAG: hypothetical protein IJX76_06555 [Clostridia bacterium]|nr:hypothetical protein [Clostridia bacterium]